MNESVIIYVQISTTNAVETHTRIILGENFFTIYMMR